MNGGAIALGHPLAATGTRCTLTLLKEMRRRGVRYGLAGRVHRRRPGHRGRRGVGRLAPDAGGPPLNWTERILEFPVRAAAVDDFLRDLRAHGTADLNAVMATLNEGGLCRQALDYWTGNDWICSRRARRRSRWRDRVSYRS